MNFDSVLSNHLIDVLGWTLVHSVWQLALIAGFLFIALRLLSQSSASLRYSLSVAALTLSVVSPVISFLQISRQIGFTDSNFTRQVANTHLQNVSNGSKVRE